VRVYTQPVKMDDFLFSKLTIVNYISKYSPFSYELNDMSMIINPVFVRSGIWIIIDK
jgi:hypothetical protein